LYDCTIVLLCDCTIVRLYDCTVILLYDCMLDLLLIGLCQYEVISRKSPLVLLYACARVLVYSFT
jgi:hypothetical protein